MIRFIFWLVLAAICLWLWSSVIWSLAPYIRTWLP